jgi:hypothetical protein
MSVEEIRRPELGELAKALLPFVAPVAVAFVLGRLRGEDTARGPADNARAAVARVGEELVERAWTVGRDAEAEARKQRAWRLVQAATGAAFTLLARRAAAGLHDAVTRRAERDIVRA